VRVNRRAEPPPEQATNARPTNPFVGASVAARYADARPPLHARAVRLLAERIRPVRRAIDLGCGTGLSTEPLTSVADLVVGVDVSEDMLANASRGGRARYVRASAENLPFSDGVFDLSTIASAIHWFDREAITELGRVLGTVAVLAVYDVWFRAEMNGVAGFANWMNAMSNERYPPVAKNRFTPSTLEEIGFYTAWHEDIRVDVPITRDSLVAYLMTHSERIAAVREGRETEVQQMRFLTDGLSPFFQDASTREVGFGIEIEVFDRGAT
jgi:SAM-dependent methyltransferase